MTRGVPMLDPKVRLKGATPEALTRALFRRTVPFLATVGKPVAGGEAAAEEVAPDETGDGVTLLVERV